MISIYLKQLALEWMRIARDFAEGKIELEEYNRSIAAIKAEMFRFSREDNPADEA